MSQLTSTCVHMSTTGREGTEGRDSGTTTKDIEEVLFVEQEFRSGVPVEDPLGVGFTVQRIREDVYLWC